MTTDAAILKPMADFKLIHSSVIGLIFQLFYIFLFNFRSREKLLLMEPFLLRIGILNHYFLCQKVLLA
jgi:hypothetical protein